MIYFKSFFILNISTLECHPMSRDLNKIYKILRGFSVVLHFYLGLNYLIFENVIYCYELKVIYYTQHYSLKSKSYSKKKKKKRGIV